MNNAAIARALEEVADLLEIEGANPYRIRAYRNAVHTIQAEATPLARLVEGGSPLTHLPGIGKEMASHVRELVETGTLRFRDQLLATTPRSLIEVMRVPAVGPKKARRLWDELRVGSIDELAAAAREGRIARLAGFGEKTQAKILAGIEEYREHRARFELPAAERQVEPLLAYLHESPGLLRLEVAGSYRRRRETVGDVDLLAIAALPSPVMERFLAYPQVDQVLMSGDVRGTAVLGSGMQVDLRIVPPESYGAALVYFTGSKEHNVRLRRRGVERGLRISEYGVFQVDGGAEDQWVAGREEADVYAAVGLPWIPPELREGHGEIEAAAGGELPRLLRLEDLRGDLQMHSTWSDGGNSIEEMLTAAAARGYEYIALTDHSKALAMVRGLDAARLREQWLEIDEVAARHPGIRLLKSLEVDILADGSLDLEDEMLDGLDVVVASVHSRFEMDPAQQTRRILTAIEHPAVSILAHPTGRLINRRKPFELDVEAVLARAAELGVAVELNANPYRLDLKDTHLMLARRLGCKVVVSTDAHSTRELGLMRYGVEQARRAWLEPRDVLNTLPLPEFLRAVRHGKSA